MSESLRDRFGIGRNEPPPRHSSFFLVSPADARLLMLDFRARGGDATGIAYSYLQTVRFDPSIGLILLFTQHRVTLAGRNLGELYQALLDQTVRRIEEQGEHDQEPEDAPVVSRLRIEEL